MAQAARVVLVVLIATLVAQGIWSALVAINLDRTPSVPWSVVVAGFLLWIGWRFVSGATRPLATQASRRRSLRATILPPAEMYRALVAGFLSLAALIALWLVLTELLPVRVSRITVDAYPRLTVVAVLIMASLVGAVVEEAGLRGYVLTRLQTVMTTPVAIVIAAVLIAPGHALTQGFVLPVLLWYFIADITFGVLASLCGSIIPVIVVHAVGLLLFFSVIWPTDHYRGTADVGGAAFWVEVGAVLVLTALTVRALGRLRRRATQDVAVPA